MFNLPQKQQPPGPSLGSWMFEGPGTKLKIKIVVRTVITIVIVIPTIVIVVLIMMAIRHSCQACKASLHRSKNDLMWPRGFRV